jgi:hypothetical protein
MNLKLSQVKKSNLCFTVELIKERKIEKLKISANNRTLMSSEPSRHDDAAQTK